MLGKTHAAIGVAITFPLLMTNQVDLVQATVGFIGANAPDIDQQIGMTHRGFTHSLLATAMTTGAIYLVNKPMAIVWGLNYLGHIIADSFTKQRVPLLYPFKKRFGLGLFKVGPISDGIVFTLVMLVILYEFAIYTPLLEIFGVSL